jgi:hypothetical protein
MADSKASSAPLPIIRQLLDYDPETGLFTWRVNRQRVRAGDVAGTVVQRGYVQLKVAQYPVLAHRLAWAFVHGEMPTLEIDHINGITNDNRIENLRQVSRAGNTGNILRAVCRAGLLGVRFDQRRQHWVASIVRGGKTTYLGSFSTAEAAHAAYCAAREELDPGASERIASIRSLYPVRQRGEGASPRG